MKFNNNKTQETEVGGVQILYIKDVHIGQDIAVADNS